MHDHPNDDDNNANDATREEAGEPLVFQLGNRSLVVQVGIVMSTPVVPGVPPRPKRPGDTALALVLDDKRMLVVQYGFEDLMQSTPVVTGSPPGIDETPPVDNR